MKIEDTWAPGGHKPTNQDWAAPDPISLTLTLTLTRRVHAATRSHATSGRRSFYIRFTPGRRPCLATSPSISSPGGAEPHEPQPLNSARAHRLVTLPQAMPSSWQRNELSVNPVGFQ